MASDQSKEPVDLLGSDTAAEVTLRLSGGEWRERRDTKTRTGMRAIAGATLTVQFGANK